MKSKILSLFTLDSFFAASANAQVVINEVYGNAANNSATPTSDFVELANTGSTAFDLNGYYIYWRAAGTCAWSKRALSGTIPANSYFLIKGATTLAQMFFLLTMLTFLPPVAPRPQTL